MFPISYPHKYVTIFLNGSIHIKKNIYIFFKSSWHILAIHFSQIRSSPLAVIPWYVMRSRSKTSLLESKTPNDFLLLETHKMNTSILVFIMVYGYLTPCLSWIKIGFDYVKCYQDTLTWGILDEHCTIITSPPYLLLIIKNR